MHVSTAVSSSPKLSRVLLELYENSWKGGFLFLLQNKRSENFLRSHRVMVNDFQPISERVVSCLSINMLSVPACHHVSKIGYLVRCNQFYTNQRMYLNVSQYTLFI